LQGFLIEFFERKCERAQSLAREVFDVLCNSFYSFILEAIFGNEIVCSFNKSKDSAFFVSNDDA